MSEIDPKRIQSLIINNPECKEVYEALHQHVLPSLETLKRFDKIEKIIEKLVKNQDRIHEAVYGDSNGDMGMKHKIDAVYTVFNSTKVSWKLLIAIIGGIGIIIAGAKQIFKSF